MRKGQLSNPSPVHLFTEMFLAELQPELNTEVTTQESLGFRIVFEFGPSLTEYP